MGYTCASVVGWLWGLSINWSAWEAVGTIAATLVALFLPSRMAKKEWHRQDDIREADANAIKQKLVDSHHEVCSTVDRILAYYEVTIALFDSAPPYWVGLHAIKKVNLNIEILFDMLELLETRTELSDGAIYSAVGAKQVATLTKTEINTVLVRWGTLDPEWAARKAKLEQFTMLALMTQERTNGVRRHYNLGASTSAQAIRDKYFVLAEAMKAALIANGDPPPNDLDASYW